MKLFVMDPDRPKRKAALRPDPGAGPLAVLALQEGCAAKGSDRLQMKLKAVLMSMASTPTRTAKAEFLAGKKNREIRLSSM
jgi:hypothetical protein